jgi:hypothetical protein
MIWILLLTILLVITAVAVAFIAWRTFESERDSARRIHMLRHKINQEVSDQKEHVTIGEDIELSQDAENGWLKVTSPKGIAIENDIHMLNGACIGSGAGRVCFDDHAVSVVADGSTDAEVPTVLSSEGYNTLGGDVVVGGSMGLFGDVVPAKHLRMAAGHYGIVMSPTDDPYKTTDTAWVIRTDEEERGLNIVQRDNTTGVDVTALRATTAGDIVIPGKLCTDASKCINVTQILELSQKVDELLARNATAATTTTTTAA